MNGDDNETLKEAVQKLRAVVDEFISDIEAGGGIVFDIEDNPCPRGDPGWTDLGATYLNACRAIGRSPLITESGDDEEENDDEDEDDDEEGL